jgi:hypothetical protein
VTACAFRVYTEAQCPICFEVHDTIAALPCGHVVCEDCLPALGLALDAGTPDVASTELGEINRRVRAAEQRTDEVMKKAEEAKEASDERLARVMGKLRAYHEGQIRRNVLVGFAGGMLSAVALKAIWEYAK